MLIANSLNGSDWQCAGRPIASMLYGYAEGASIGQCVCDLEIVAKASEPAALKDEGVYLPL